MRTWGTFPRESRARWGGRENSLAQLHSIGFWPGNVVKVQQMKNKGVTVCYMLRALT